MSKYNINLEKSNPPAAVMEENVTSVHVKLPTELHKRLMIEKFKAGITLPALIIEKLRATTPEQQSPEN